MIEWLFFDRVDTKSTGAAVTEHADAIVLPATHETASALAVSQFAKTWAQVTLQAIVVQAMPVLRVDDVLI